MGSQRISEIIQDREIFALPGDATAHQAQQLMEDHGVNAVVIVDAGVLVGIFSERDLAREQGSSSFDPEAVSLSEVMTPEPDTIGTEASAVDALERMDAGGYRHLPVVDKSGKLVGVVSRRDFF